MENKGNFTQIPDEWWQLCGKYPIVDKETGEIVKDKKGKDKYVDVSHTSILLLAKISSFIQLKHTADGTSCYYSRCTASCAWFADKLNIAEQTVRNTLKGLYDLGWLRYYKENKNQKTVKRTIYVEYYELSRVLKSKQEKEARTDISTIPCTDISYNEPIDAEEDAPTAEPRTDMSYDNNLYELQNNLNELENNSYEYTNNIVKDNKRKIYNMQNANTQAATASYDSPLCEPQSATQSSSEINSFSSEKEKNDDTALSLEEAKSKALSVCTQRGYTDDAFVKMLHAYIDEHADGIFKTSISLQKLKEVTYMAMEDWI